MPPQQMPQQPYKPTAHRSFLIPFVITLFIAVGLLAFGLWAFMERNDYKNNTDQKIESAVAVAVQEEASRKETEFLEREKSPVKKYIGPDEYGTVEFSYPKTWSSYVLVKDGSRNQVDAYFHPGSVPDVSGDTAFALRVQIVDQPYDEALNTFAGKVKAKKVKVAAYKPKNVKNVTAVRISGEVGVNKQGSMVLIKLRDKTLQLWTESRTFTDDFDKFVLETLKFVP